MIGGDGDGRHLGARSHGRRRCRPTRCGGWPTTSRAEWRGRGKFPPGPERLQPRPHPPDRPRPAAAAARRLRRARADLQHAAAAHAGHLHARPGGQPLRHRRPPGELPLARVELRRPDPAARRRPADGRRRLPRPRPGDHDARLPPRAGRGLDGGDGGRGGGGDRARCRRRRWSTSTTGCATWRCGSRCGRCSGSTPTRPARAPPRPSTSSARSATTGSTSGCGCCAARGSPWRKLIASRAVLDEIVFGEIARRRADPDPERRDILSLLVGVRGEGGEAFTDREIRDQVMTLMFAGHDTSTSTLTFMLHELARHPDVARPALRGAGPGARRRDADDRPARARDALPRDGPRRGPAPLPAGLDRPAPRRPRVRVRRLHGARAAPTSTTAPGPATASPRSSPTPRPSSPSASPASARRRCRAAPTSPSAAASGSASASASARPR